MKPIIDHDLCFDAGAHRYSLQSQPDLQLTSVTQLIHQFSRPFEKASHAARVALRRGVDTQDVIDEWDARAAASCVLGTDVHEGLEQIVLRRTRYGHFDRREGSSPESTAMIHAGFQWLADHVDNPTAFLQFVQPEVQICWPAMQLAGTIDLVCEYDRHITLVDWKTNADMKMFGHENMYAPLNHLPDSSYWHYVCQLHLYQRMLRQRFGIYATRLVLVWLRPSGGYQELYIPDIREPIKKLLAKRERQLEKGVAP